MTIPTDATREAVAKAIRDTAYGPWILGDNLALADAAIAAMPQGDAERGWQRIETAPRETSDTKLLLYCHDNESFVVGWWYGSKLYPQSWCSEETDKELNPTHWMPLPIRPSDPMGDVLARGVADELKGGIPCEKITDAC